MPPEVDELLHLFGQRLFKEKYCCSKLERVDYISEGCWLYYKHYSIIISRQKIENILYRNKARVSK